MFRFKLIFVLLILFLCFFEIKLTDAAIMINEFLASNRNQLEDPDEPGEFPDWIELYNSASASVDLGGMYLTDNLDRPTKWQIPTGISVPGSGFVLFYADSDEEQGDFHTNFKINADGGIICLIGKDGQTVVDSIRYSEQSRDISYGRSPDGSTSWYFFNTPTPRAQNGSGFVGSIADITFSHERGFYETHFSLTLATSTAGAEIYYTTDGSEPRTSVGSGTMRYSNPIPISTTTCVRAKAVRTNWKPTEIATHTYIFLNDVIRQDAYPDGFPNNWAHTGNGDYEMDPEVVQNPLYRDTIKDDLKAIPTLSLVMDVNDWFGGNGQGIYLQGELVERAVSAELIHSDATDGFQINCAVMIIGGTSTDRWKSDKLSMRLKFKDEYGPPKLRYPLFGEEGTDEFDTVVLDARLNHAWNYGGGVGVQGRPLNQRDTAQYTRDQLVSDIQNALGGYAPHGRHVHLYLNGLYWGLYCVHERPDEHFAASYFRGNAEDYDVIKHNPDEVVNGSNTHYQQVFTLAGGSFASDARYRLMQRYVDIPNFIDYIIMNFYFGNWDWAHQNWYATRNRVDPDGRWRYHCWDAEHVMESLDANVTDKNDAGGPSYLHQRLKGNASYRQLFVDHVHRHFFNGGIFTPERMIAAYQHRLDDVDRAVVGESARWGDNRRNTPYTRDAEWVTERDWILNTYLPQRTAIVLNQLRHQGLYPNLAAPAFFVNGAAHPGGQVAKGVQLSMTAPAGQIYFTIDGSDPAQVDDPGGDESTVVIAENAEKRVIVPKSDIGGNWKSDVSFDDSAWRVCSGSPGGVGYENDSGYENWITLDVRADMHNTGSNPNPSCYIRIPFSLTSDALSKIKYLTLNVRYDDGFIAYLNGIKITKANVPDAPQWNSTALENHEAVSIETFDVSGFANNLKAGNNLLAIHGMNIHTNSSDFIITAELVSAENRAGGMVSPSATQYTEPVIINETTQFKARTLNGSEWSALNEAVYLVPGEDLSDLKLTEIHYHPLSEENIDASEFEFIELKNIGSRIQNLTQAKFVCGIGFTFPGGSYLNRGDFIVLASNTEQFEERYQFKPFGEFEGNLDNAGERIVLLDALGDTLISLRYNDKAPWPTPADGNGYSMVTKNVNPIGDPGTADYWRTSYQIHGSPDADDEFVAVDESPEALPKQFALRQNFPNPFNAATKIEFSLPEDSRVRLMVYDILGQQVRTLLNVPREAGRNFVIWHGKNDAGLDVANGIYFVRLQAKNNIFTRKMILIR